MNPFTIHPRSDRPSPDPHTSPSPGPHPIRQVGRAAAVPQCRVSPCRVCGFSEVRTDEVVDRGAVLLAECPRCEHRWTQPASGPFVVRPPARRAAEVAPAA
jgi:hypothetical protein